MTMTFEQSTGEKLFCGRGKAKNTIFSSGWDGVAGGGSEGSSAYILDSISREGEGSVFCLRRSLVSLLCRFFFSPFYTSDFPSPMKNLCCAVGKPNFTDFRSFSLSSGKKKKQAGVTASLTLRSRMSTTMECDTKADAVLVEELANLGQSHLLPFVMRDIEGGRSSSLLNELAGIERFYHGGIVQYIRNAQRLLRAQDSSAPASSSEFSSLDQSPRIVHAPSLLAPSPELQALEQRGAALMRQTVFVLVAGGLGERLGFSGIKLSLPVDTASERTYLQHYISWIHSAAGGDAPLVIMTSDDTHQRTVEELAKANIQVAQDDAGTLPLPLLSHVYLVKQETVPCLEDRSGRLAITSEGKLIRKPHGHGDVHSLLYSARESDDSGSILVEKWLAEGKKYIVFLQDTNASSVLTIPVSLAISDKERLAMNFTCVPRMPKEAIGLLCRVGDFANPKSRRTVNIEYNKFEAVAHHFFGRGDVAAEGSPFSPFPGSINTLLYRFDIYAKKLKESHGQVPEFINPKYRDATKTSFKSPSRVESLMQDFALLFDNEAVDEAVGGTVFERQLYHPVKNSLAEGIAKVAEGIDAHCAATGEENVLLLQRQRLHAVGVSIPPTAAGADLSVNVGPIQVALFPVVSLTPQIAYSFPLLQAAFPTPGAVRISDRSVLIIEGNVEIRRLDLDGMLTVKAASDSTKIVIDGLCVSNASWRVAQVDDRDSDEVVRMRGYRFVKSDDGATGAAGAVFIERRSGTYLLRSEGLSRM